MTQLPYHGIVLRTASPSTGVAFALLLLATSACATSMRTQRPDGGTVTIGVTASGSAIDAMAFRVTVEPAGISGVVRADAGVLTRSDVPPGDHVVRLLDLPARCRVDGGAERTITLSPQRRSAVVRFHVVCG
jgi:hypothetical protein